jgi:hypothetical protein
LEITITIVDKRSNNLLLTYCYGNILTINYLIVL